MLRPLLSLLAGFAFLGFPLTALAQQTETAPNHDYAKAVLVSKPFAYWRLSEIEGDTAKDASGNERTGMFEEGIALHLEGPGPGGADGKNPTAHFAGGRVRAPAKDLSDNYSVEMWLYNAIPTGDRPVTGYLFSRGVPEDMQAPGEHLAIGGNFASPGRLLFFNGNEHNQLVAGGTPLPVNTWNHVVLVRNDEEVLLYINGELDGRGKAKRALPAEAELYLGGRSDGLFPFEGHLDEFALYDRTLSADEVASHFKASGLEPAVRPVKRNLDKNGQPIHEKLAKYVEQVRSRPGEWQQLFNGTNFEGFTISLQDQPLGQDAKHVYQVVEGVIHVYKDTPLGESVPYGILLTDKEYSHYHLRFEYKWGVKKFAPRLNDIRDAGLLYHTVETRLWPTSIECQVQEGDTGDLLSVFTKLTTTADRSVTHAPTATLGQFLPAEDGGEELTIGGPGAVNRIIKSGTFDDLKEWTTVEVIVEGDRAIHLVNGRVNNACYDLKVLAPDGQTWQPLTQGRLAFQAEAAEVFYRNLEIKTLEPTPAAPSE